VKIGYFATGRPSKGLGFCPAQEILALFEDYYFEAWNFYNLVSLHPDE